MPTNWNPKTRHYERDGKPIRTSDVRQWVVDTVEAAKARMESIAKGYIEHRNSAELAVSMREEIRNMHVALSMIAQGGKDQMTNSAWGKVANVVKSENTFLRGFERDVANGLQSDAQILARAIQYAESGWATYQRAVFAREKEAGVAYVHWRLDESAEHCNGCLESEGVHPMDDAPELGSNECGGRCRCWYDMVDDEAA